MISAKIIADSKNKFGNRVTTWILTYPRLIHSEFMTHRSLSKNSSSSRAVPFKKMLKMVRTNPFIPIKWMKEHKGMQGTEYFSNTKSNLLKFFWLRARDFAVGSAWLLSKFGLTKQICNRLLEPFMWHIVICTGSEWENFFSLRAHEAAEIHIQDLAYKMLEEYNNSIPKLLNENEWHIPFGDKIDEEKLKSVLNKTVSEFEYDQPEEDEWVLRGKLAVATARCARLSYKTLGDEKEHSYDKDIELHDRLISSGHFSPFEHACKVMSDKEYNGYTVTSFVNGKKEVQKGWCGNFRGFIQYRKMLKGENRTDERVIKKIILY